MDQETFKKLKEAIKISPDPNDIDFFALALKTNSLLWTNDTKLKKQNKVKIISTDEFNFPVAKSNFILLKILERFKYSGDCQNFRN